MGRVPTPTVKYTDETGQDVGCSAADPGCYISNGDNNGSAPFAPLYDLKAYSQTYAHVMLNSQHASPIPGCAVHSNTTIGLATYTIEADPSQSSGTNFNIKLSNEQKAAIGDISWVRVKSKVRSMLKMFKKFIYYILGEFEDAPALTLITALGFLFVFLLVIWNTVRVVVIQIIPENTANLLFIILVFSILGLMGLVVFRYQEAPIFIIPMTGPVARLFGLILLIGSVCCLILAVFNYLGHPLIR